jgi:HAMP domain-containing protein
MDTVTTTTLVIIFVVIGVLCVLIYLMSAFITAPLSKIMEISREIISMIGTEESKRDYTSAVTDAFFVQNERGDEIGALTSEFFVVVTMLHNKHVEKKRQPKYPPNPFYLKTYWENRANDSVSSPPTLLNWPTFLELLSSAGAAPTVAVQVPEATTKSG